MGARARRIRRSRARGWTSARRWCRPSVIDCFGSIFDEEEEARARVGARLRWISARRRISAARAAARAIAQTKTRDRLCVSGGPGHDVIGFERGGEGDAIVPAYALRGHEDVVFGMDFIHRDALASASRDGSLRIFRLPRETSEEECAVCASPVVSIEPTRGGCGSRSSEKLRGVKLVYDAPSPQLATISSSGTVYQFDASTPHVVSQEYKLRGFDETSCVATDGRVVAAPPQQALGPLLDEELHVLLLPSRR